MAEEQFGEKTEQPTDRRREQMRERGNVARSQDLTVAASVLAATMAMSFFGPDLFSGAAGLLREQLVAAPWSTLDSLFVTKHIAGLLLSALKLCGGWMLAMVVAAVLVNLAQVGFLVVTEPLMPQWSRINPLSGLQRLFSSEGAARLAGSMLKLVVLGIVAQTCIRAFVGPALLGTNQDVARIAEHAGNDMIRIGVYLSLSLMAIAGLDYLYHWWKFEQDLKMTKEEIREEYKEMDGDPHIRQRRREAHKKLVQSKQMNAVKTADAVVTNPTEIAVAIKYDESKMAAPIVVAKGMGEIAARIRKLAAEHRVPIVERKPLARALYRDVKVGRPIPLELYSAVAEILAYVYRLRGKGTKDRGRAA
jgi:flagellar biosynthetic protein FlhB